MSDTSNVIVETPAPEIVYITDENTPPNIEDITELSGDDVASQSDQTTE